MMTVGEILRELSKVGSWASQPNKVRVLAARYYANVDSIDDLQSHGRPRECSERTYGGTFFLPALLTTEQVRFIRDLR